MDFMEKKPMEGDKMKKGLFTTLLILVFAVSAMAGDGTGFGLKGGLNMANMTGDDVGDDNKALLGFAFGGFFTYSFSPSIAIQPEVLYSMKGVKYEEGNETLKYKLNYLEVPVLLKFSIATDGNMVPFLFAGPAFGFLMSAKAEFDDGTNTEETDIKDDLKSMDIGITFGAGFGMAMGEGQLTLDARYTLGMTEINDDPDDPIDLKNTNISIMLGFSF